MGDTDFILTLDDAMPAELCDELVRRFEQHHGVCRGQTSSGVDTNRKNSRDLCLDRFEDLHSVRNSVLSLVADHVTDYFIKYPYVGSINPILTNAETGAQTELTIDNVNNFDRDVLKMVANTFFRNGTMNVQKYPAGTGGYPHWHCEISPDKSFEYLHRIVLWMYYLNDVNDGGETEFYFQKVKVKPKKGTLVIAPAGFTHTHRGNAPISNDKYIVTSWLLYNRIGDPIPQGETV